MGLADSKPYRNTKILHYITPNNDYHINVYLPEKNVFRIVTIKKNGRNFNISTFESISIPSGAIYLVGGKEFVLSRDNESSSLIPTDSVYKINLNKQDENGVFDLAEKKQCKRMPEPRYDHLLVYSEPWIFAIGGYIDSDTNPTNTCLKFHTKEREWYEISPLGFNKNLCLPCGIVVEKNIYVFDTVVPPDRSTPTVYKYIIETDRWMMIGGSKMRNTYIPPSNRCNVFQVSKKELMIMAGVFNEHNMPGFHYTYHIYEEKFSQIETTRELPLLEKDRQGDVDYSREDKIYFGLQGKRVKIYHIEENRFYEEQIEKSRDEGFGVACCSRGK